MGDKSLRSQSLDLLRFPLALVIVLIHTFTPWGLIFQGQQVNVSEYTLFNELQNVIDAFLRGQSVPIYYFISGFVFFLGVEMTRETYLRKFRNRVHSLLIPYLVWNTLAILLLLITLNSSFSQYTEVKATYTPSLSGFLSCFWVYTGALSGADFDTFYPLNGPLWFIRNLMVVVVFTPLLYRLLRNKAKYITLTLFGFVWFTSPWWLHWDYLGLFTAFFFFSWGASLSINRIDMLEAFGKYAKVSTVLYFALGFLHLWATHNYPVAAPILKQLNVMVGLLFAYNLAAWLLKRGYCKVNSFLASASFFIYIAHSLILTKVLKLLYVFLQPASSLTMIGVHLMAMLLTVGGLLLTFYFLRQYAPGVLKVVAGRK